MARYRKIDTRIWNDQRFASLADDAKLVFLFLLTHPHLTSLGAMRTTVPGLAAELGWKLERFEAAFRELCQPGSKADASTALVEFHDKACFVGLPNFLKYNAPENPNVVKSWESLLDLLPECDGKARLVERARCCLQTLGEGFVVAWERVCHTLPKGLGEPFRNGMPNPEPEPEQEQEPNHGAAVAAGAVGSSKKPKSVSKTPEPIAIPVELDHAEFRAAWEQWREHRRQLKKPMTALSESKALDQLRAMGLDRALAAINHSIANGWQGIFEPTASQQRKASAEDDPRGNFAAGRRYLEMFGGAGHE